MDFGHLVARVGAFVGLAAGTFLVLVILTALLRPAIPSHAHRFALFSNELIEIQDCGCLVDLEHDKSRRPMITHRHRLLDAPNAPFHSHLLVIDPVSGEVRPLDNHPVYRRKD